MTAIGEVFESVRRPENPLLIGEVKTNLGHGEATNAISSLMKTVLCLEKGEIPATIGIKKFNPALNFRDGRPKVAQSLTNWPNTQYIAVLVLIPLVMEAQMLMRSWMQQSHI